MVAMSVTPVRVGYEPMSALEVAQLKTRVREQARWDEIEWGNYGPDGDQPLEKKVLADHDTDHLEAILITQPHLGNELRAIILELLKIRWREENARKVQGDDLP
jgi:hypothetical protein